MFFPTTLLLATKNPHKKTELRPLLKTLGFSGRLYDLNTLEAETPQRAPLVLDALETGKSFYENAYLKAASVFNEFGLPSLADDSGLVVPALGGAPGLHSAHYAGPNASDKENRTKLLQQLRGKKGKERAAFFKTVVVLVFQGKGEMVHVAEGSGVAEGELITAPRGKNGFGYDSIFVPQGGDKTFGELSRTEKNRYSHRARALTVLFEQLKKNRLKKISQKSFLSGFQKQAP